jgi:predicted transporter
MSERWKYQIKTGAFWGIFMSVFNVLFEIQEKPLAVQLSSQVFYLRAVVFLLVGIFLLGYVNWKQKVKQQNNQ